MNNSFKDRLAARDPLLGTFVKTPSPILCEVLGKTELDVLCLDAEHSPFDRLVLDQCLLALRAEGMSSLVRVPSAAPEYILNALDGGATGVVVPHVKNAGSRGADCGRYALRRRRPRLCRVYTRCGIRIQADAGAPGR